MERVAQDLGAVDPERVCPLLDLGGVFIRDAKTQHRHTQQSSPYDKRSRRTLTSASALVRGASTAAVASIEIRHSRRAVWARLPAQLGVLLVDQGGSESAGTATARGRETNNEGSPARGG